MNFNRHNYEEFFILYMDNELGSEDRRMVEAFVQQHPDLKEELDILLQYKLTPDNSVVFPAKEELMKVNGDTPVTLSNYEEWMVLYTDNELSPVQRKSVEQFIEANPAVKGELALLMKAKLQPEEIVFANKEILYKKEERVRAIPVRFLRMAVAAILILAIGITAVLVFNNKSSNGKPDIAKTPGVDQKNTVQPNVAKQNEEPNNNIVPEEPVTNNKEAVADNNNIKQSFTPVDKQNNKNPIVKNTDYKKPSVNGKVETNLPAPIKKQDELVVDINNKPSNNLPQPFYNPNVKTNVSDPVIVKTDTPNEIANRSKEPANNDAVTKIIPVSYNNSEQLEEGGKNKKNRGFLRKLTRTFEKRTNINATDDDRLLVGGLAIKLK